jgi:hypothetical protein
MTVQGTPATFHGQAFGCGMWGSRGCGYLGGIMMRLTGLVVFVLATRE